MDKYKGMRKGKNVLWILVFNLLIFLLAGNSQALDYPHFSGNNIGCDSCHFIYGTEPGLLPPWTNHVPQDIDDTQFNTICWSCHNDIDAPYMRTHSSLQIDNDYGDWTVECRVCHNPHYQKQKDHGSEGYIYSGTSTGVTATTLTDSGAGWTTDAYSDMVVIPNVSEDGYVYKITGNTSDTLTIEGPVDVTKAGAGDTFAIIYGKLINQFIDLGDITATPSKSGNRIVRFFRETGTNSFADGNGTYDGICEVCHTETTHFRNDGTGTDQLHANVGGAGGARCTQCHNHTNGFAHGGGSAGTDCQECHGHDPGYGGFTGGKGSYVSHSTHTENDPDDLRGPNIDCTGCHEAGGFPYFKSGTDGNGDGKYSLTETDVCDTCHSPGGTYDGVNDSAVGVKNNWSSAGSAMSPVYAADGTLRTGKEKWCATCHDETPSQIQSINAPNVIGDEDGSYIYGSGWGYYKTGHGLSSGITYPASGGVTAGAGRECLDCHLSTSAHVDGAARTFDCGNGCDSTEYRVSYRLQQVGGKEPMDVPWPNSGGPAGSNSLARYRLCVQSGCHDTNAAEKFTSSSTAYTNLVTNSVNRHNYHLSTSNMLRYPADYNYGGSYTSRMTCVICHNVHGSTRLAMVRDGKLINREPGLMIWYRNDDIVSYSGSSTNPPVPEDLPLSASTGTLWRAGTSGNLCSHCHSNNNVTPESRTPYQDVSQAPALDWTGETNYTSDGVNPDSAPAESSFAFRIKYTDTNNDAPTLIEVWVDEDDSGTYDVGEKYNMTELDGGDINYTDGKIYTKSLTLSKAGDNTLTYRFNASDGSAATGDPASDSTLSVTNNAPVLSWTGETYYISDGVNPNSGGNGTGFEFRVQYTDADNESPGIIEVWVDEDDSGVYEGDEKFAMTISGGDGDFTNGENYTKTLALAYTGDGIYNYRFYATEGIDDATGGPVSDNTVTVTQTANNAPTLEWYTADCLTEGVRPSTGAGGTEYEFMLKYVDADNQCPSAASDIQVWIDEDDSGAYEPDEKFDLNEDNAGDTDCSDGKIYILTRQLAYAGDGVFDYRFFGYDGADTATGSPATGTTVTVLNGVTVRPSGSGLTYNYTSIDAAVDTETGTYVVVYPNDNFSAATYTEKVTLISSSGHDLVIKSACGADLTTILSSDGGTTITVQDVSNTVFDGFSITGATTGYGVYINRIDSTSFTISNSRIYGNEYGIYVGDADYSPVKIENTKIYSNSVRGIHLPNGYASDIRISDSEIYSHNVSGSGAAIYLNTGSAVTLSRSIIRDNITTGEGGAIYTNAGNLTIENTIFADNQGSNGGVIRTNNGPTVSIVNSTFADNTAVQGGVFYICAVGTTTVRNSIFWNNTASASGNIAHKACSSYNGFLTITDSDLSISGGNFVNGTPVVSNNITPAEDPLFVNASADDYHIQAGSPVIDQAGAAYAPADDIDGDARPRGSGDDMGADEYVPANNLPVLSWTGQSDYTTDGVNPDSAAGGSSFEFRVEYTDADNDAPSVIQVWLDEDDDGTYQTDEKYDMTVSGGDSDYTNGESYTKTLAISYAGDGTLIYRFYASDGTEYASGAPASDSTVDITNNAPALAWTGQSGYAGDGVNPDMDVHNSSFEFRVNYMDTDNSAPGTIQVWVDTDDNGAYEADEKYDMTGIDTGDTDYTDGKLYTRTLTLSYAGNGVMTYLFYASDGTDDAAGPPTSDSTVTVTNNAPALAWTGEAAYASDGVDPDSGGGGSNFEFRIDFTDSDNNSPSSIQVWVDADDSGVYEADEKYDMTGTDGGDTTYTDGKRYTKTLALAYAGDGIYNYRFYAADGAADATGAPVSDSIVTVTSPNNVPTLAWTGEANYTSDGADPDSAAGGSSFEFRINYTDADNEAPSSIQVWVDEDDSGTYEVNEKYNMTVSGGDSDYTNGELYTRTLTLSKAGDNTLNYRFYASDGTADATGSPASGSTVTMINNAPSLAWTGETNYSSDGVDPDSATGGSTFTFRVDYTDMDNEAPSSIQVWVDRDDSGTYSSGEKFDMTAADGGDIVYTDGKRYVKDININYAGDGILNYRFVASDGTDNAAGAPASDGTVTIINRVPTLAWTGETNYTVDGVDPESAASGSSFTFRIDYTDGDNKAPSSIQVWVDENDNALYEAGEKYGMTGTDIADTTYTDGKRYSHTLSLSSAGDSVLNYRFYASDGSDDATGAPVSGMTVTVTPTANNAPVLGWYAGSCRTEGVRPGTGASSAEFEFQVEYTDDDNEAPAAIQVWIDEDDDATYQADEKFDLTETDGSDTDYTDGKYYKLTKLLSYAGDGTLNYRFYASDGTDTASGTPASGSTVTILSGVTVRPAGSALTYDYTSIITAANSVSGNILVYPNDDFSAATYTENIILYNKDNRTIRSVCGADLTVISSSSTNHTIVAQDSSYLVVDGFSITGATAGSGFWINRNDATTQTIRNSKVYGNSYGIYINDGDDVPAEINNVEIYNNSVRGIHVIHSYDDVNITNCEIHSHNSSSDGPALYAGGGATVNITNSILRDNITAGNGGAISLNAAVLTIENSAIYGNQALTGGAMYLNTSATVTITRSVIRDNTATGEAGAIYTNGSDFMIENSILTGNQGTNGGVIRTNNGPTVSIVNSTFADNTATNGGVMYTCASGSTTIRNSIFRGNTASSSGANFYKACGGPHYYMTISDSDANLAYPAYSGGRRLSGSGTMLNVDPLFIDPAADDYHIQSGSPVIDQASAAYAPADDIDGESRPSGSADDMGADEYTP